MTDHIELTGLSRRYLTEDLIGVDISERDFRLNYRFLDAYFNDWYDVQCDAGGQRPQDLIDPFKTLRSMLSVPRNQILDALVSDRCCSPITSNGSPPICFRDDGENHNKMLALAARLYVMVSIDPPDDFFSCGRDIPWSEDVSLASLMTETFRQGTEQAEESRLPAMFTAANVELIAGIQVVWTCNLADHLLLTCDDTQLKLFHHASFLELHKQAQSQVYPTGLIDETLLTLALLIPATPSKTRRWFQGKVKSQKLDPRAGEYGPLNAESRQLKHFHYWRDRLSILKQTFDESEPRNMTSWWYDDRKKVQRATFWIAFLVLILTVCLGVPQTVTGIVQAWAAVKAMQKTQCPALYMGLSSTIVETSSSMETYAKA